MSEGLNRVTLLGNLGADPDLKRLQNGTAVLKMRLATSKSWVDAEGTRQEQTEWHQVTVWGKRAETLSTRLHKGDRIYVEGELRTSFYEKEGQTHYSTEVSASNVLFAGVRPSPNGQTGPSPRGEPSVPVDTSFEGDIPF